MRLTFAPLIALALALHAPTALAFTDADLIDGFNRTVFGSEYNRWGWQSRIVKKFTGPVRFYVDDRSGSGRSGEIVNFIRSLNGAIRGLDARIAGSAAEANFRVLVLNRRDYQRVAGRELYGRENARFAPGKCVVRLISGPLGITRSDAVIVADEGDFLFRRCMVEEILQGLGPVNDDRSLKESVFNDETKHTVFTEFDRSILNMLYHPAVRAGMTARDTEKVLPGIVARLHGG